jgi:hypothetical protein
MGSDVGRNWISSAVWPFRGTALPWLIGLRDVAG